MKQFKTEEIIQFLLDNNIESHYLIEPGDDDNEPTQREDVEKEFGKIEVKSTKSDYDDGCYITWFVIIFIEQGICLQVESYYQSYIGSVYKNDWKEVKPITKTVTVYE